MKILIIIGLIVDLYTKEPLVGVKVASDEVVYTDFNGEFNLKADSVDVSYISYKSVKVANDSIIYLEPL